MREEGDLENDSFLRRRETGAKKIGFKNGVKGSQHFFSWFGTKE